MRVKRWIARVALLTLAALLDAACGTGPDSAVAANPTIVAPAPGPGGSK